MPRLIEISTSSSPSRSNSPSRSPSSSRSVSPSSSASSSSPSRPWVNLPPYVPSPERPSPPRRSPPPPTSPPRSTVLSYQHHADLPDSPVADYDTWRAPVGKTSDLDYGDDAAYVDLERPRDMSVVPLTSEHMSVAEGDVSGTSMSASMLNKSKRTLDKNISIETNFPELLGTMKRLQDEVRMFGVRKMQTKAFAQQELIILHRETLKIQKADPDLLDRMYLAPPTGKALEEMRLDIRNIDDHLDDIAKEHLMLIDDSYEHRVTPETEEQLNVLDEKRRDLFDRLVPRHKWPLPSRIPRWVGKKAVAPPPAASRGARGAAGGRPPVPTRGAPSRSARPASGQQPRRPVASSTRNLPPPRPTTSRTRQGGSNMPPPRPTSSGTRQGGSNMPPPRPTSSGTRQGGSNMPPPRPTTSRTRQGGSNMPPPRPTSSGTRQGGSNMPPPRPTTSRTRQGGSNMPPPRPTTSRTRGQATRGGGAASRGPPPRPAPVSKLPVYQHRPGDESRPPRPPKIPPRPTLSLAHRLQRMEMWIDFHQRENVSGLSEPDESLFNSLWERGADGMYVDPRENH